ncbi:glycosyltransferase family 4 protein [Alteromonas sp. 1_MG-2023]|uniref:glycosyltransferase family 4 protein n=1 Tax=Alteromonas sp. 1_MG-2023 TaxID=3062669 RepID=UPI0026E323BC|nr:glycosyltransferase family 4 protein [Alteromonas sp. 1_MG-2023]MDO6567528.1 glycosyltransferase family 4 protein [Alteromonas sp. 1_MG-2023]
MMQVVVIGYVWPEPNSSAAGQNMLALINHFLRHGHQVTFMTAATDSPHKIDLESLNVKSEAIALNCSSFNERIAQLSPNVVIFDRYMTEEQFSWRVKDACPCAIRILNTEDVHSLRQARHDAVKAQDNALRASKGIATSSLNTPILPIANAAKNADYNTALAQREIASILRSDITLVISRTEYALLTDHYQVPAQQLYYHPLSVAPLKKKLPSFEQRNDIVTIGNFRHAPNWDAVLQLKQTIWPAIRKVLPNANLHIYGAYPPKKATQLHNPKSGFYIDGWAEDAEEVIANARLLIAPLRFGAGIKGKILEAMHCETPTLTTWVGAEGISALNNANENLEATSSPVWGGTICETAEDFAVNAARLYNNQSEWALASQTGLNLFHDYENDKEVETLAELTASIAKDVNSHRSSLFLQGLLWHQTLNASKYMSQWIEAKNQNL